MKKYKIRMNCGGCDDDAVVLVSNKRKKRLKKDLKKTKEREELYNLVKDNFAGVVEFDDDNFGDNVAWELASDVLIWHSEALKEEKVEMLEDIKNDVWLDLFVGQRGHIQVRIYILKEEKSGINRE